jgi:hypothetical protein
LTRLKPPYAEAYSHSIRRSTSGYLRLSNTRAGTLPGMKSENRKREDDFHSPTVRLRDQRLEGLEIAEDRIDIAVIAITR